MNILKKPCHSQWDLSGELCVCNYTYRYICVCVFTIYFTHISILQNSYFPFSLTFLSSCKKSTDLRSVFSKENRLSFLFLTVSHLILARCFSLGECLCVQPRKICKGRMNTLVCWVTLWRSGNFNKCFHNAEIEKPGIWVRQNNYCTLACYHRLMKSFW